MSVSSSIPVECLSIIIENSLLSSADLFSSLTACMERLAVLAVYHILETMKESYTQTDMCFKVFGHNKACSAILKVVDTGPKRTREAQLPLTPLDYA